jgi:hypothetical protein
MCSRRSAKIIACLFERTARTQLIRDTDLKAQMHQNKTVVDLRGIVGLTIQQDQATQTSLA